MSRASATRVQGQTPQFCRDLILLQLSIRHFVGPGAQDSLRKSYDENAQGRAAAQTLARLSKTLRRAEHRRSPVRQEFVGTRLIHILL